jgi:hypothetical protein
MFFEDIGFQSQGKDRGAAYRQDLLRTIDFHVETFAVHGWRVVPVGMEEARRHPLYPWFDGLDAFYALSRNGPTYTRICYMRWLAYATAGLPFADLDVMNFGFTPEDAVPLLASERPALISAANPCPQPGEETMGLGQGVDRLERRPRKQAKGAGLCGDVSIDEIPEACMKKVNSKPP